MTALVIGVGEVDTVFTGPRRVAFCHAGVELSMQRRVLGWTPTEGDYVELRQSGLVTRRGIIESVMFDKSSFWLAAEGVDPRIFVDVEYEDHEIWSPESTQQPHPQSSARHHLTDVVVP
ncbi:MULTISPECIES: hypothetical protein [unclassified Arthrobacter]|uniref:hypothetical protein n=1 Tax=unclassified Arthrobacter TaxID=235627 RepID=UPI00288353AC|nr:MULTISPECIES: hypothetical protein [unclassified Arthrobacter]